MDIGDILKNGAVGAAKGYITYRIADNKKKAELEEERQKNLLTQKEEYKMYLEHQYRLQENEAKHDQDLALAGLKHKNDLEVEQVKWGGRASEDKTKYMLDLEKAWREAKSDFEGDMMNDGSPFPSMMEWGRENAPTLYKLTGGTVSNPAPGGEDKGGSKSPFSIIQAQVSGNNKRVKGGANPEIKDLPAKGGNSPVVWPAPLKAGDDGEVYRLPMVGEETKSEKGILDTISDSISNLLGGSNAEAKTDPEVVKDVKKIQDVTEKVAKGEKPTNAEVEQINRIRAAYGVTGEYQKPQGDGKVEKFFSDRFDNMNFLDGFMTDIQQILAKMQEKSNKSLKEYENNGGPNPNLPMQGRQGR